MNPYSLIDNALDIFDDNIHAGRENISIDFQIEGAVTGLDRLGNPERGMLSITVEGRAVIDSKVKKMQQLPGTSNRYLSLKINVTKVNGILSTSLPTEIVPLATGIATYAENNGNTIAGQFRRGPSLSKTISKIHQKVGDIIYGTFEVNGDGN